MNDLAKEIVKDSKIIRVAFADDHTLCRKALVELINSFGQFKVVLECDNGAELLEKMDKIDELPDICILDIAMPKLNGYDCATSLRKRWPEIKILALTMYKSEYAIIKMLGSGAHGYILKYAYPDEIKTALLSIYNKSYYHSELMANGLMSILSNEQKNNLNITNREFEFLNYCGSDLSYKEMGEKMGLSARSVETYRDALFGKLKIRSRSALVVFATNMGISYDYAPS